METIAALEKEIKLYKVDLAKQYNINTKLSEAHKAIRRTVIKRLRRPRAKRRTFINKLSLGEFI
jgi:hypothetical protein